MVLFTDSDHAGCLKARKSTSSSKLFCGSHVLRSTSTTQRVIALSSGESEFCALLNADVSRTWSSLNAQRFGIDISKNTQMDKAVLEVRVDALAGRGIAIPQGAGRIRHNATPLQPCGYKSSRKTA